MVVKGGLVVKGWLSDGLVVWGGLWWLGGGLGWLDGGLVVV